MNYITGIFALLFAVAAVVNVSAQSVKVKGNGNVISKTYSVSSFDRIELNGLFNTVIRQSGSESVRIEIDDNLQQYFKPEVEGNTLRIVQTEGVNIRESKKHAVYISVKSISSVSNNGVGNLSSDGLLESGDFSLICNGVGNVDLELKAESINLVMSSVGNVELEGSADNGEFTLAGVGNVDAEEFKIENLKISNSGVGNAKVYVTGEIQPAISGAGNIRCKGNPKVNGLSQNGVGKFKLD